MPEEKPYLCRQWLKRKYWDEMLSTREIAKLCGIGHDAIRYHLIRFGIKRRKIGPAFKIGPGFRINVLLQPYLHESLKKYAKTKDQKLSEAVREILLNTMINEKINPFK